MVVAYRSAIWACLISSCFLRRFSVSGRVGNILDNCSAMSTLSYCREILYIGNQILVDEVLSTDDTKLAKSIFDNAFVCERCASAVHLTKAPLVQQITNFLKVRVPPGNVWLKQS